nr:immunoglobulin light chain junction region [Macaca mulatta]
CLQGLEFPMYTF